MKNNVIETESRVFFDVLGEKLMEQLSNIQPEAAVFQQEKVILANHCDGSCSGCSSCTGIN